MNATPEQIELIASAIRKADAGLGYNLTLTRLVDGESTYTLTMEGRRCEVAELEDGHAIIEQIRNLRRAEAVLGALAKSSGERT